MKTVPGLLTDAGRACLLLPTKVFFNKTDTFQSVWLRKITLEKVIQLADYSFILFTNSICPCVIARFTNQKPDITTHSVDYFTPKVTRVDLRQGAIPIAPSDRKEIPLRLLLSAAERKSATITWKSRFWGTHCDLKFLNHLFALPKLKVKVDQLSRTHGKRSHPWVAGQGCKPWDSQSENRPDRELRPFVEPGNRWSTKDEFVTPEGVEGCHFRWRQFPIILANIDGWYAPDDQHATEIKRLPCPQKHVLVGIHAPVGEHLIRASQKYDAWRRVRKEVWTRSAHLLRSRMTARATPWICKSTTGIRSA